MKVFARGKCVGTLDPTENIFRKTVKRSKHLFRTLNAYGIDAELLGKLVARGAEVQVHDTETDRTYRTTAWDWSAKGLTRHFKPHGEQVFLRLEDFDPEPIRVIQEKVVQKSLFVKTN